MLGCLVLGAREIEVPARHDLEQVGARDALEVLVAHMTAAENPDFHGPHARRTAQSPQATSLSPAGLGCEAMRRQRAGRFSGRRGGGPAGGLRLALPVAGRVARRLAGGADQLPTGAR